MGVDDVQVLVDRAQGGDGGAFGELYERFAPEIRRYLLRQMHGRRETAVKLRLEVHHPFTAKVHQRFTAKVHQVRGCADDDLGRRVNVRIASGPCQAVVMGTSVGSGRSAMRKLRPVMRRTVAR